MENEKQTERKWHYLYKLSSPKYLFNIALNSFLETKRGAHLLLLKREIYWAIDQMMSNESSRTKRNNDRQKCKGRIISGYVGR